MNDFLPDNYQAPAGNSNYMKFHDGENKFRILSKPILGWLGWDQKTPHRFPIDKKPERKFDEPLKHFWAFIVFNYNEEAVQILEITQSTIQRAIADMAKNDDWGAPYEYDIKVTRRGKDLTTEYSVMPSPKKPVSDEIKKMALDKPCYLQALYTNDDPWTVTKEQTDLAFTDLPF